MIELASGARFVLLGEATHGTHEFYRERAEITKRLIVELGFDAVAVEADWPDAYRANCWVRGASGDGSAGEALSDFERFPTWMWRNRDVEHFLDWLRDHNDSRGSDGEPVGFYGLDLYSLHASMRAVVDYLDRVDADAAARARARYACFDQVGGDPQAYAFANEPCEDEVVAQLIELRERAAELATRDGRVAEDRLFAAEQSARLVRNAERYYRSLIRGDVSSWNVRDQHMAETLDALAEHLSRAGRPARIVVWAHNSHLGDARATDFARRGELNLGQLACERWPGETLVVGFSTDHGTVSAASDWDAPVERKRVRPALEESYEQLFHTTEIPAFLIAPQEIDVLAQPRSRRSGSRANSPRPTPRRSD